MSTIARRATAALLALAMAIAFTMALSTQEAYADWNNDHTQYWKDGDILVTDCVYYVEEDKGYYYFDEYGFVQKKWIYYDHDEPSYCYGDPNKDGMLVTGWKKIGGYWYYFAPKNGYSQDGNNYYEAGGMYGHGLEKVNGKWYYFYDNTVGAKWGKLQYGWISDINADGDKVWYYADPSSGVIATGWKKVGSKWYYFEPSEAGSSDSGSWYYFAEMHYGGIETIKGNPYYFAKGGALQSGWIKEHEEFTWYDEIIKYDDWYYADPNNDSRLVKGWKKISGYWYYFGSDYEMYDNNTWAINGKLYVFTRSGKLPNKEGWYNLYEEYFYTDGESQTVPYWTYANSSGIATVGWKKISGYWYYFDTDGFMEHDAWIEDSSGWCYVGSNGKMYTSKWFYDDDEEWYYFDASGHMVTGAQYINGKHYTFDEDGHWIP